MPDFYAPISGINSFGDYPFYNNEEANMIVFGAPLDEKSILHAGCRLAPRRIREVSGGYSPNIDGAYDYEMDQVFLDGSWKVYDAQDVSDYDEIKPMIEKIQAHNAMPIMIGGNSLCSIPVIETLKEEDICVIQLGANLKWKDSKDNESTMRQISKLKNVSDTIQIGIRGIQGCTKSEYDTCTSTIITSKQANSMRVEEIVNCIPKHKNYYFTINMDVYDTSQVIGVERINPSGMEYYFVDELMRELVKLGNVVGMDLVEVSPELDPTNFTVEMAASTMICFMGYIQKSKEGNK